MTKCHVEEKQDVEKPRRRRVAKAFNNYQEYHKTPRLYLQTTHLQEVGGEAELASIKVELVRIEADPAMTLLSELHPSKSIDNDS